MVKLLIFAILCLNVLGGAVIELNMRDFSSKVANSDDKWLIEFYAPWCGHCRNFAPVYEDIAQTYKQKEHKEDRVKVAKVDATQNNALALMFGVNGYPTIFLVQGREVRKYSSKRGKDQLMEFVATGYLDTEPMPFWSSPFGPVGIIKREIGGLVDLVKDSHTAVRKKTNLSSQNAAALMVTVSIVGIVTVSVVVFAIHFCISNRPKQHQD